MLKLIRNQLTKFLCLIAFVMIFLPPMLVKVEEQRATLQAERIQLEKERIELTDKLIQNNINTQHEAIKEIVKGELEIDISMVDVIDDVLYANNNKPVDVLTPNLEGRNRIRIWEHAGGKQLNKEKLVETIAAVSQTMPNIIVNEHVVALVLETYMVETDLGAAKYDYSAKNWSNYGLGQIRDDTAKYLLKTLKKKDKEAFAATIKYYDRNKSLRNNLLTNVPFSIAVTLQYYKLRGVVMHTANTIKNRAVAWKKVYNTYKGAGSVEGYTAKVNKYRNAS